MCLEIKFSQYVPLCFSQTTQVPEELQSCVHLLARTYRYETLSLARRAVSCDTSEETSYKYEGDMRALVDGAREQVSTLLRNHTEGITSTELWTLLQRLGTLRVVFLGEPEDSVYHLSHFYGEAIAGVTVGLSLAKACGSVTRESSKNATTSTRARSTTAPSLLEEYIIRQNATNALYWSNPDLVSFLFAMLIGLDTLVVPVLGSDVVRALLNAVMSSHQSSNVGTIGQHGSAMHSAS
ncbi:hypothetical protein MRX96_024932 [Rhipicephalus microplus]